MTNTKRLVRMCFEWTAKRLGYYDVISPKLEISRAEIRFVEVGAVHTVEHIEPIEKVMPEWRMKRELFQLVEPELAKLATFDVHRIEPHEPGYTPKYQQTQMRIHLYVGVKS